MKQVKSTMKKYRLAFAFLLVFGAMLMTGSVEAKAKEVKLHPFLVSVGQGETGKDGVYTIGKWGFQDDKGNIVIEPIYEKVGDFSEGLCAVQTEEEGFYINTKGEKVISFEDSTLPAIGGMFKDGTADVMIRNAELLWEDILIDKNGNRLNKTSYESIRRLDNGYFYCEIKTRPTEEQKYEVVDKTGKVILKDKAFKKDGDRRVTMDKAGEKGFILRSYVPFEYSSKYAVYNLKGKKILNYKKDNPYELHGDTIWEWDGKKYIIYNWSGKKIGSTKNDYKEGYISDKGKVLINAKKYDYAGDFIDGVALIEKSGKYSLINEKGKVIKNLPKVYRVERITSGLILLEKKNGSQALMNTKGKYVFKFGKAGNVKNRSTTTSGGYEVELVEFIQNGKLGVLSGETGKVLVPAEYEEGTGFSPDVTETYRSISVQVGTGRYVLYDFDGVKIGSYKGDLSRLHY